MKYTFRKPEHLCLKREIEELFSAGNTSMSAFPMRATFKQLPYDGKGPQVKILLSVSKRHFKHAVDRNRAKRQLREAYRLNKHLLLDKIGEGSHVVVAFIWLSDEHFKSSVLHAKMRKLLLRIGEEL